MLDYGGHGSRSGGLRQKGVPIKILSPQRNEQIARLQLARIRADARKRLLRVAPGQDTAGPLSDQLE